MPENPFYIVDVFAENRYEGNQLAVIKCENKLTDNEMQILAQEMNYSETAFITSEINHTVRFFSPKVELDFAGHPTIGTALIFQQEIIKKPIKTILLDLKIGTIPVLFKYKARKLKRIWMEQKHPVFGQFFSPELIANMLNISVSEIDTRFNIQEVSTGIWFIIVPLKTLDSLKKAKINEKIYGELIKNTRAKSVLIFSPETYRPFNDLSVRVFSPFYGIQEDPGTGSGNGCLGGYLLKHDYFVKKKSINLKIEQGYEIERKSLIFVAAEKENGNISVAVGGNAFIVAKGTII